MIQGKKKRFGKNTRILLYLIIIVAAITGYGLNDYLSTMRVPVFLFADDYSKETHFNDMNFVRTEMDRRVYEANIQSGAKYASADDLAQFKAQDDVLAMDVIAMTPFSVTQAVSFGGTTLESRLGKNMVSVELPTDVVTGLTAGVRVGSRLNLLSGFTKGDVKESDLKFENLLVLEVLKDESQQIRSVYVELEPSEAIRLVHSLTYEAVTACVLKPGSYISVPESERSYIKDYAAVKEEPVKDYWSQGSNTDTNE